MRIDYYDMPLVAEESSVELRCASFDDLVEHCKTARRFCELKCFIAGGVQTAPVDDRTVAGHRNAGGIAARCYARRAGYYGGACRRS